MKVSFRLSTFCVIYILVGLYFVQTSTTPHTFINHNFSGTEVYPNNSPQGQLKVRSCINKMSGRTHNALTKNLEQE